MKKIPFGSIDGVQVEKFTLTNGNLEADIITYGGALTALRVKDKAGKVQNVVLGHETLEQYRTMGGYWGALVGRFGNRIENASFELNGVTYRVGANENGNSLHGGFSGFDKKIWQAVALADNKLELQYLSKDGEEGFPGNLEVTVTYTLTEENGLVIDYRAVSDKDTVINLTNHAYFNVHGVENTTKDLQLQILADAITAVDEKLIPHGELVDVTNTLFDFRTKRPFVCDLSADEVLHKRGCYDENFVLQGQGFRKVAELSSRETGITMQVITDQPGMQIYTGNPNGIALETQNFPNAVNCPNFPSAVLKAKEQYHTVTEYRFI